MNANDAALADLFRRDARSHFEKYTPRIVRCLQQLSDKEIWWRPNKASNSAGNIVLHLCGNVRRWIVSGLGGAVDVRTRDAEFAERGPISRRALITRLKKTVQEACDTIDRFPPEGLAKPFTIQGFHVTGLEAIAHVCEHFSHHTGQIIYVTKMKRGKDLRFTRLPVIK